MRQWEQGGVAIGAWWIKMVSESRALELKRRAPRGTRARRRLRNFWTVALPNVALWGVGRGP